MILECVILNVIPHQTDAFEKAFKKAEKIISSMNGYISHELKKSIEKHNRYLLLVQWETIEDHMQGFRKSEQYSEWKDLLHHFYDPFPHVEHYRDIDDVTAREGTVTRR